MIARRPVFKLERLAVESHDRLYGTVDAAPESIEVVRAVEDEDA